jgi:AraC-like DNA-binding protein
MTLDFNKYCQCKQAIDCSTEKPTEIEIQEGILVILMRQGISEISIPMHEPAIAGKGTIILVSSTVRFTPSTSNHYQAIHIVGLVADDLQKDLMSPTILLPGSAVNIEMTLIQLVESDGLLASEETSALSYSVCCRAILAAQKQAKRSALVEAALGEMHEHYAELYGIEELAMDLMVSKGHLHRCFIREIGVTPGRYLTIVRINQAKRYLVNLEFSLDMVAGLCGFSSANYFCKVFKKEIGETPTDWRQHYSNMGPPSMALRDQLVYL